MAEQFEVTPKDDVIKQLNEIIEENEFKHKRREKRLSPKEKRHHRSVIDFYKSIVHHLKN